MCKKQRIQTSKFDRYVTQDWKGIKNISMIQDNHWEVFDWVEKEIQMVNLKDESGREGMTVESVLRYAT